MKMDVPDEVFELLWFADGKNKNWDPEIYYGGVYNPEPSAIYEKLPVSKDGGNKLFGAPDYFPNYRKMIPKQRRIYLDYLKDIYDFTYPISYVFLFYYGLERHLSMNDKYEESFRTIMKLRDAHPNSSFQSYSANALLFSALEYEKVDLIKEFLDSYDKSQDFSDRVLYYVLYKLEIPLTPKAVFYNGRFFGYDEKQYNRRDAQRFIEILESKMIERYGSPGLLISDIVDDGEMKVLNGGDEFIYANFCIEEKMRYIPDIRSSKKLSNELYDLLIDCENDFKEKKV